MLAAVSQKAIEGQPGQESEKTGTRSEQIHRTKNVFYLTESQPLKNLFHFKEKCDHMSNVQGQQPVAVC